MEEKIEIGTVKRAKDIGFAGNIKYVWSACKTCGKARWVQVKGNGISNEKCVRCGKLKDISPCPNPKIGDVRMGRDIGRAGRHKWMWNACTMCGKERWVPCIDGIPTRNRCTHCARIKELNPCPNPTEGDKRYGRDIGKADYYKNARFVYITCKQCGSSDWIPCRSGRVKNGLCWHCRTKGKNSSVWKGGRIIKGRYIHIQIKEDNPYYSMADKHGYIAEHRLVMAEHLGRVLRTEELVHHKDGNRQNNNVNNLELTAKGRHIVDHSKGYGDGYEQGLRDGKDKQVTELKEKIAELKDLIENQTKLIKLLQWQMSPESR